MKIRKQLTVSWLLVVSCVLTGCTPKVLVRKANGVADKGVRYYRPKPYLFISPSGTSVAVKEKEKETTTSQPSDEYVSIELQYLPDFSEEYSIDVRPGLGTADVSFTLKDGWMLTELNQNLDSQFDENVAAIAELVKGVGSVIPTEGEKNARLDAESVTKKWVVSATNVPLGYYESVISRDCKGKKLAGWKYVGFAPFNSCPTQFCDSDTFSCSDMLNGPVYGLAFVKGVMTFRQLNALRDERDSSSKAEVFTGSVLYKNGDSNSEDKGSAESLSREVEETVQQMLKDWYGDNADPGAVKVSVDSGISAGVNTDYVFNIVFTIPAPNQSERGTKEDKIEETVKAIADKSGKTATVLFDSPGPADNTGLIELTEPQWKQLSS
ncbi:MAG: hypothetical protein AAFX06_14175 [Planctomycetota bacterium]